jgi:hypothetical protein
MRPRLSPHVGLCFECRRDELVDDELRNSRRLFYISFAGEGGFRGACVVEAYGPVTATRVASALGINPGGQALVLEVPAGRENLLPRDRLLSREDLEERGGGISAGELMGDVPENRVH